MVLLNFDDAAIRGFLSLLKIFCICPAGIYLVNVDNRNTKTKYELCLKLTIKTMTSFWCLYC